MALQPLVDRMTELLLKGSVLHADETPVAFMPIGDRVQLVPGNGKTKKASVIAPALLYYTPSMALYLWAYRSNDLEPGPKIVVFDYRGGRSGDYARQFLGDWQGHLLVDDYSG